MKKLFLALLMAVGLWNKSYDMMISFVHTCILFIATLVYCIVPTCIILFLISPFYNFSSPFKTALLVNIIPTKQKKKPKPLS